MARMVSERVYEVRKHGRPRRERQTWCPRKAHPVILAWTCPQTGRCSLDDDASKRDQDFPLLLHQR